MRLKRAAYWQFKRMQCARFWLDGWYNFRDSPTGLRYPRAALFWATHPRLFFRVRALRKAWANGRDVLEV